MPIDKDYTDILKAGKRLAEIQRKRLDRKLMEEIITNDKGGKNSSIGVRYDLIPALAIKELAKVLSEGAEKYAAWNWLKVEIDDHINHSINHTYNYLGTTGNQIEELSHAFCRLGMALELLLRKG